MNKFDNKFDIFGTFLSAANADNPDAARTQQRAPAGSSSAPDESTPASGQASQQFTDMLILLKSLQLGQETAVGQIYEHTRFSMSELAKALNDLKTAGLVNIRKDDKIEYVQLTNEGASLVMTFQEKA